MSDAPKKYRGKGKRPAMVHLSVRVSPEVAKFYVNCGAPTVKIREVLTEYALHNLT